MWFGKKQIADGTFVQYPSRNRKPVTKTQRHIQRGNRNKQTPVPTKSGPISPRSAKTVQVEIERGKDFVKQMSFKSSDKFWIEIHLRTTGCRLSYGITPATRHKRTHPALTPASESWYSIYLSRRDGRLSWPGWLVTYRDGLPAHRRSPIQVLTGPGVE